MISINKDEALYLAKLFPPKKVRDMYTGDLHIERMVRRTKNHFLCTEISAVTNALKKYRGLNVTQTEKVWESHWEVK